MPAASAEIDRYAEALCALGQAAGALPSVEQEVMLLTGALGASEPLRRFLADPAVRDEGKRRALDEWLSGQVRPLLRHFLLLVHEEGRLSDWPAIADAFLARVSALRSEATGELVCAVAPPPEKVAGIEAEVGRLLGKQVKLFVRIDANLLGGLYVRVGDFVVDGTVDNLLDKLHADLLA